MRDAVTLLNTHIHTQSHSEEMNVICTCASIISIWFCRAKLCAKIADQRFDPYFSG